ILFFIFFIALSCNNNPVKHNAIEDQQNADSTSSMGATKDTALKKLVFAVNKDLVCGMPVTAGISDTTIYNGKIYGFCAPDCKAEFLKDPNQFLTAKK
ncbi:MAG: YHS domain-containing protein, partial [Ferruginibacter sp.]